MFKSYGIYLKNSHKDLPTVDFFLGGGVNYVFNKLSTVQKLRYSTNEMKLSGGVQLNLQKLLQSF